MWHIIRQAKKEFFANLNIKDVTDNEIFQKTMKPLFTGKIKTRKLDKRNYP